MAYKPYTSSYIPSTVLNQDMTRYGRGSSTPENRTFFDRVFPEADPVVIEPVSPVSTTPIRQYRSSAPSDTGEGDGSNSDFSTLPQYESGFLDSIFNDIGFGTDYDRGRATSAEDLISQGINKYSGTADTIGDISSFLTATPLAPIGVAGSIASGLAERKGLDEYARSLGAPTLSKSQIALAAANPVKGLEDYAKENIESYLALDNNRTDFSRSPEQAREEQNYLSNMGQNMTVAELSDQLNNPRSFDAPTPTMSVDDYSLDMAENEASLPTLAPTFSSDYYTTPQ